MRVFLAGASGAIGRSLVPQLVAAGHDVTGTTRSEQRAEAIRAAGGRAAVCDVLDANALRAAVAEAAADVVVDELTALPERLNPRNERLYDATNRGPPRWDRQPAHRCTRRPRSAIHLPEHRVRIRARPPAAGHGRGRAALPGRPARPLQRSSAARQASTTWSTTSLRRCATGCPRMPRRSARSHPCASPAGWLDSRPVRLAR
jgi:NAD(P)H-binding